MTTPHAETWLLRPHDPLVLGTGRRPPAQLSRMTHVVPLPPTLAGAVRARFIGGANDVPFAEAQKLLDDVSIRGPWLQRIYDAPQAAPSSPLDAVLVQAPLHVRVTERSAVRAVTYPQVVTLPEGAGVLLPDDVPPSFSVLRWSLPDDAHKSEALRELLPLRAACELLLDGRAQLDKAEKPILFEGRVHVSINAESQTAEPSALYSSSGVRYADDLAVAVEVTTPAGYAARSEHLLVLGGEGRVASIRAVPHDPGPVFPEFGEVRERYNQARSARSGATPGLLLMLVTPASFSTQQGADGAGWIPPWLRAGRGEVTGLADIRCELAAVATDRYVPVSGWSLAHREGGVPELQRARVQGMQRAVRRLVPAGTVYYLRLTGSDDAWMRACEHFWGRAIDTETTGDPEALLAAPHRDGYGMVIPGLWWPQAEGRQR